MAKYIFVHKKIKAKVFIVNVSFQSFNVLLCCGWFTQRAFDACECSRQLCFRRISPNLVTLIVWIAAQNRSHESCPWSALEWKFILKVLQRATPSRYHVGSATRQSRHSLPPKWRRLQRCKVVKGSKRFVLSSSRQLVNLWLEIWAKLKRLTTWVRDLWILGPAWSFYLA